MQRREIFDPARLPKRRDEPPCKRKNQAGAGGDHDHCVVRVFAGAQGMVPAVKQLAYMAGQHGHQGCQYHPPQEPARHGARSLDLREETRQTCSQA